MADAPTPHDPTLPPHHPGGRDQDPERQAGIPSEPAGAAIPAAPSAPAAAAASVQALADQAGLEGDKTVIIVAVLVLAATLGVVALVVMNRQAATQPRVLDYTPHIELGMSSQEEIRSFTSKTSKEVTEIDAALGRLSATMDGLIKRQDDTEALVRSTLKSATDTFTSAGSAKVAQMEAYAEATRAEDPRTTRIIDEFRSSLATLKESPAEAKARAGLLLRQAGVSEDRIRNLLAEAAQQAGRLEVGYIAEPALSAADISSLPAWVQPLVSSLHDQVYALGQVQGRFYPEQALGDIRIFLRAHAHREVVDAALVARIAQVVRIRRENLTPELTALLPGLVSARDQRQLAVDDHAGLAHLVWMNRARYPLATTAGQMLSLCEEVGRAVGAVAHGDDAALPGPGGADIPGDNAADADFRALDTTTQPFAIQVVQSAVVEARQFGKTPAEQAVIAARALHNYLDTMRMTARPEQAAAILHQALGTALPASGSVPGAMAAPAPAPGAGGPDSGETSPPGASSSAAGGVPAGLTHFDPEQQLYFGPVRLAAGQVAAALICCLPGIVAADGLHDHPTIAAAALIGALEQVPRIVSAHLARALGTPMGGLTFMQAALPEVMERVHCAASLGGIALPVSVQRQEEHDAPAEVMRGVAIGAIYGPLLHDAAKATAAAPDALAALEAQPPLTPAVSAQLAGLCATQPLAAMNLALAVLRPGTWDYPGVRFGELAAAITRLEAEATALRERLQAVVVSGQDGTFAENLRLLIPLSVAEHDDRVMPCAAVEELVRRDLVAYATQFLSESQLSHVIMDDVIPRYAAAMSEEAGGGTALVQEAVAIIPVALGQLLERLPPITGEQIAERVAAVCAQAEPQVEQDLVRAVVLARVLPRLRAEQTGSDPVQAQNVLDQMRSRAQGMVTPPYTPARIDGWATALTAEGLGLLHGRASGGPTALAHSGPQARALWAAPTMLPTAPSGPLVGGTTITARARHIVLPANTYGDAHLQTGVDAEIGGRANVPVMLQLDLVWNGPADSRIVMRGCRVSGVANALAGPQRVAIDLKELSYVFPSGRELDCEIHGYVADNLTGQFGALGVYHWNADKVLPMAVIAGGFKGAADTLKAGTSTTIVGAAGQATVAASEGSQLQQAGYGAVSGGFGIMSDYVQAVLNQVHPSVSAVNGQSVSVVLLESVEITVPEGEWSELTSADGGFAP